MSFIAFSTMLGKAVIVILQFLTIFLGTLPFSITGIVIASALVLMLQIPYLGSLVLLPYIYGANILTFFGIVKRDSTWCVVYDSKTKIPIDPAYVTVRNMQGKEVSSIITDLNGRFSLLLPRGLYTIEAGKTNYTFPSLAMIDSKVDGKYTNLYFGSIVEIADAERSLVISIPMDPIEEDWNQVEKKRRNLFYRFDDTETYFRAAKTYSIIAMILAMFGSLYYPSYASQLRLEIIIGISLVVLAYTWHHRQYAHSFVLDKKTRLPVGFAKVSIFSAKTNNKVSQKITSYEGQFTCLLSKGLYYVTIEKRNEDGTYDLAYTSSPFSVNSGYVGKRFTV